MDDRAAGRGSGNGIHSKILDTGLGCVGATLAASVSETRGCRADVGHIASGASLIQSWAARTEEGLSRCGTFGKAADLTGANLKFRARCRTAPVAKCHAHKVPADA